MNLLLSLVHHCCVDIGLSGVDAATRRNERFGLEMVFLKAGKLVTMMRYSGAD
jgi:hypothetical protein